jgi:putative transposase
MISNYLRLFIHYIWGTWKRFELIDRDLEPILKKLIHEKAAEHNCRLLAFGCMPDHLHVLIEIHPAISISKLVQELKGYSSYTIANIVLPEVGFRWQRGYGAMTISGSDIPRLTRYINHQKEHHGLYQVRSGWEIVEG